MANGVFPILSMLSYKLRRPTGIRNIILKDLKHHAVWGMPPSVPHPVAITQIPLAHFIHTVPFGSMFALYREGMTSINEPYKFLCYFKILEAYTRGNPPFNTKKSKSKIMVTKELLEGAYQPEYHDPYLNINIKTCLERLADHRNVIAHPFKNKRTEQKFQFINMDLPNFIAQIGGLSNLLERIVTKVLDEELVSQAAESTEVKKLLDVLNNIIPP